MVTLIIAFIMDFVSIPFEPSIAGITVNIHLVLEYLAFFVAFQYYIFLRRNSEDTISNSHRLTIILGATIGAFLGSRIMGFLENPIFDFSFQTLLQLINVKTIMGALFGGLIGVEIAKWKIGEKQSSGDLFTLPIILGIFIGRIGCFLYGTREFTYGTQTSFFMGMNLGDGLLRHPIALYEIIYLMLLFFIIQKLRHHPQLESGYLFQIFMLFYFGFRFFIEFIKPNSFHILGLSSIQWLCIVCFAYYKNALLKIIKYAY